LRQPSFFLYLKTAQRVKMEGVKNKIFENPGYGKSHWFMPLKYHGDGVVRQHGPALEDEAQTA
jgi:hypothetical protein